MTKMRRVLTLVLTVAAFSACHVPSTFTTARVVAPGRLTAGLGVEPTQVYRYKKTVPDFPPIGPTGSRTERDAAVDAFLRGTGSAQDGEVRGGMPVLLVRYGIHSGCDIGARFAVSIAAIDYKCRWFESRRFAVAADPQLGYVYTVNDNLYSGDGVTLSLPILASFDVVSWMRITVSPGVSMMGGRVFLRSNEAIQWPQLVSGRAGSRSSPILDGLYARAGLGVELHSRTFSVQPEVTVVTSVATLEPVTSWHTGIAFLFGAIP